MLLCVVAGKLAWSKQQSNFQPVECAVLSLEMISLWFQPEFCTSTSHHLTHFHRKIGEGIISYRTYRINLYKFYFFRWIDASSVCLLVKHDGNKGLFKESQPLISSFHSAQLFGTPFSHRSAV